MRKKHTEYKEVKHLDVEFSARVKFNETDPLGIVWHGNYISYFEEGREAFGRKHGISYLDIHQNGFTTPIVEFHCENKIPLRYGEVYRIITSIVHTQAAKMIFVYKIFNEKKDLVCEGRSVQAFVDNEANLSLYPPKFYEKWKKNVNFDA